MGAWALPLTCSVTLRPWFPLSELQISTGQAALTSRVPGLGGELVATGSVGNPWPWLRGIRPVRWLVGAAGRTINKTQTPAGPEPPPFDPPEIVEVLPACDFAQLLHMLPLQPGCCHPVPTFYNRCPPREDFTQAHTLTLLQAPKSPVRKICLLPALVKGLSSINLLSLTHSIPEDL